MAQRRKRVFVVGYLGDWRKAGAVLFEREGLQGDAPPSRGKRQEITETAGTLAASGGGLNRPAVAHTFKVRGGCEGGGKGYLGQDEKAFTVSTGQDQHLFADMKVRRLTPIECERLQGFPDDFTKISDKTADTPRYKALGNSMAVPVIKWLGERIETIEGVTA